MMESLESWNMGKLSKEKHEIETSLQVSDSFYSLALI